MSLDFDTLDEIAEQALTRPSDAMFWDDRLFTTHGAILSWASRGDDILEESNYKSALDLIKGAAGDDAGEHVIDGSAGHWLVGTLETIYVQVYADRPECNTIGCEEEAEYLANYRTGESAHFCEEHKEGLEGSVIAEILHTEFEPLGREFTPAFVEAAELLVGLQDYPIIDESDFSEREWKAFEDNCSEALESASNEYDDDTLEEATEIQNRIFQDSALSDLFGYEPNAEVSWERVAEIYAEYRDAYFEELAYEAYRWNVLGYNPDQLELPIVVVIVA
ncbi:hypothetical protein SEA_HANK144_75 [Streptomyces phage Hank144]|uniref:Uncharacterized protein n=1 Tax=Streptomyces phage Hank144 TaxID=2301573 RepID=A0A385DNZ7_9CAUD|nr:hypothetical protein KGG76_gp75 [Streptomyces phage Hank144]AXQ61130.1 hypothetical protein SEA_HANK144_75 [Streptomyces phage Hank144]